MEYTNRFGAHYKGSEIELIRSCLEDHQAQDRFTNLRDMAKLDQLNTDDRQKLLLMQYRKIDFLSARSAASLRLNPDIDSPRKFTVRRTSSLFGCNAKPA